MIVADISPLAKTPKTEFLDKSLFEKLRQSISEDLPDDTSMPEARKIVGERLMEKVKNRFIVDFFLLSLFKNPDTGKFEWKFCVNSLEEMLRSGAIKKIDIPGTFKGETILIHGANSDYILKEDYESILEKVPNGTFVVIQNAGHYLHVEKPNEFIEIVAKYLK